MREGVTALHYFPYIQEIPAALIKFYSFLEANFSFTSSVVDRLFCLHVIWLDWGVAKTRSTVIALYSIHEH